MPIQCDTQGVMSSELLTYGISLVTSDLPVCRAIFRCVKEVAYIEHESTDIDLKRICIESGAKDVKTPFFEYERTVRQEEKVIKRLT